MANNMTDIERVAELWQQWITEHDQPDATIHELVIIAERQARLLEEAKKLVSRLKNELEVSDAE